MNGSGIHDSHYYRALKRSIVGIVMLVALTPLLLISVMSAYQFHTAYQDKVLAHLSEVVEKHAREIDRFLLERLVQVKVTTRTYSYQQLSSEPFLKQLLQVLQEENQGLFVDLGLIDDAGIQVAYAGPFSLEHADYAGAEWFQQAMRSEIYLSDVFLGLRKLPHFIVAVRHNWEGRQWILRATIDFIGFNRLVEAVRIGETGKAVILNRAGEYQTSSPSEPTIDAALLRRILKVEDQAAATGNGASVPRLPGLLDLKASQPGKEVRITQAAEPTGGRTSIYVTTPLKNGNWFLIYQQEKADAFRDLYRARLVIIGLLLVGGLLILATTILLTDKVIGRITQADREKEMMNEQVIEAGKLASIGELASGIAHEINNPVAIMVEEAGWIQDLLSEVPIPHADNAKEVTRALEQIRTQGARCKQITHKLLSFARKTDPRVHQVQLNDLVEEVLSLSEQRARYAGVTVARHLTPDLPPVSISPSEMQQVLLNLINNAVDAMEKQGGALEITTRLDDGRVVVDVADTGPGIPQAARDGMSEGAFDYLTKPCDLEELVAKVQEAVAQGR